MTEPPGGPPGGAPYDDRGVHARHGAHEPGAGPREHEPEPAFEGPLHLLSRAAWQTVLFTGVASLVLGVLVLVWPGASLLAAGVLFGLYLVISGILQLAAAFGTHRRTSLRVLAFISGAVSILLGLFCFRGPLQSVLLLALWIGIGWLFRGVTQIVAAAHDPAMPARGWHVFLGVVTVVAGIVLIDSPVESATVLMLVGGWWLVVVGVVEIVTSLRLRGQAGRVPRSL
ncbi:MULTISPECIES: HdeD family acid-resistance protein [Streptomyces]|uniref:HdeD family acid-resistance protein n=1 Tax=Streptomyces lienomycini TaxID=284035 RepID=A0ABV9WY27_9ACTN|nr:MULTISPECIES: HdeD family acid-resistance protein [Streptomyces]